ncbi:hypothetical protein ACLKA7_003290 [Drosophila subpalustris]
MCRSKPSDNYNYKYNYRLGANAATNGANKQMGVGPSGRTEEMPEATGNCGIVSSFWISSYGHGGHNATPLQAEHLVAFICCY